MTGVLGLLVAFSVVVGCGLWVGCGRGEGGEVGWVFTCGRSLALLTADKAYLLAESRFPLPSEDRLQYPEPGSRVLQCCKSKRACDRNHRMEASSGFFFCVFFFGTEFLVPRWAELEMA